MKWILKSHEKEQLTNGLCDGVKCEDTSCWIDCTKVDSIVLTRTAPPPSTKTATPATGNRTILKGHNNE